jgi:hypothetical protein
VLAAGLGHARQAEVHFARAIAQYEQLGAPAWAAITRHERDRLQATPVGDVFRCEGPTWQLVFGGHAASTRCSPDTCVLLCAPGQRAHTFLRRQKTATGKSDRWWRIVACGTRLRSGRPERLVVAERHGRPRPIRLRLG